MMRVDEILDALIGMSRELEAFVQTESNLDDKLEAFDRFLKRREPLVGELKTLPQTEDKSKLDILFQLDDDIRNGLKGWMVDTQKNLKELKKQRESIVKAKHAQGGYTKQRPSTEGYFIDKKK